MNKLTLAAVVMLTTMSLNASAEVNFSGFASVVGGVATDSDIEVRGYDDNVDFKHGSFFALQAYSDLTNDLSATVQIRARGRDDWEPEFTWAYLSYQVSPSWRIQAGRQRIPMYLYSDYLDVSYAYHWIAPPGEVYKAPFDSIDGIASIHDLSLGDATVNFRLYYGSEDFESQGNSYQLENIFSAVASINYGWWTFRSSYLQFDFSGDIGLGSLVAAWEMTPFAEVGADIDVNDDKSTGLEFGIIFDNYDWLIVAEYIPSALDNTLIGDYEPWMVSVGKRFDKFMIHATYGEDVSSPYRKSFDNVPRGIDPGIDALIAVTEDAMSSRTYSLPFYSVGLRWDFHDSAAMKFEYTHSEVVGGDKAGVLQAAIVTVF